MLQYEIVPVIGMSATDMLYGRAYTVVEVIRSCDGNIRRCTVRQDDNGEVFELKLVKVNKFGSRFWKNDDLVFWLGKKKLGKKGELR